VIEGENCGFKPAKNKDLTDLTDNAWGFTQQVYIHLATRRSY
jgi:hypothetical protein